MATTPLLTLHQGSSKQIAYKWIMVALGVLGLVLVAFAFNDTGEIELFDNSYKIGLGRITKAIAFIVAILGLQVVAGFTGQTVARAGLLRRRRRLHHGDPRRRPQLELLRDADRGRSGLLPARHGVRDPCATHPGFVPGTRHAWSRGCLSDADPTRATRGVHQRSERQVDRREIRGARLAASRRRRRRPPGDSARRRLVRQRRPVERREGRHLEVLLDGDPHRSLFQTRAKPGREPTRPCAASDP